MFIRRTTTRSRITGEPYSTYRLVEGRRAGNKVRQHTLLNLGSHFDLPQTLWPQLAARIDQLLRGQNPLLSGKLTEPVEALAQRYAAHLVARQPQDVAFEAAAALDDGVNRFQEVDLGTLERVRPRSVGVEHAALSAIRQLGFDSKLAELGFNKPQIAAALGNVIGRMTQPASELATHAWLQQKTALGELIGYDYEGMDLQRLYRSADMLLKHRDALESHLFDGALSRLGLTETITLYDLTNTYFEGIEGGVKKAKQERSKEKRSDCPLVTLAMVLDVSGFPKRSRIYDGNVSEAVTLEKMLEGLGAAPGCTVVMDAGIATETNLIWLKVHGYHYVVVSRKTARQFDPEQATEVQTAGGDPIQVQRVPDKATGEILLYCYSPARAEKDSAIDTSKAERFEAALQKIRDGLTKPRGSKNPATLQERIGRVKEKYARAVQHYRIELTLDEAGKKVVGIHWEKALKPDSAASHPGVYCLRTTLIEPTDAELWRIYSMLTNLEAVFRSLKTDLGLRPVYHQIDRRVEGHLFVSVLAYYLVHTIRLQLKADGIDGSWEAIRTILSGQVRITTTLQRRDGKTVHVRKASRPEPAQLNIYTALKLSANPGGTHQTTM